MSSQARFMLAQNPSVPDSRYNNFQPASSSIQQQEHKSKMAPKNPVKVADYTVLPLTIPPSDSYPTATKHYLYVRAHAPKIPDADTNRSLFASNLPIDASENSLRTLFSEQLGGARLDRVEIEGARPKKDQRGAALSGADSGTTKAGKKRKRGANTDVDFTAIELPQTWDKEILKSGSGAVLVFVDKASAELALKEVARAAKKKSEVRWKGEDGLRIERYRIHHHLTFPPRDLLQTTVNTFLTKWANMEGARARAMAKQRSVPDDDGFVTVTRGGRAGPARLEEAQAAGEKLKEKQKPPENFYRFQTREKKKETAEKLKREFQEDRKRVERMRAFKGKIKPET
ncbi:ribosomal RNA-processing protein 7-domain-containing protein [Phyllosticta capitalensis]